MSTKTPYAEKITGKENLNKIKEAGMNPTMYLLFLAWILERWAIYARRVSGMPKPWTNDKTMQNFFFTMPHREFDKTTIWFRENIRKPSDTLGLPLPETITTAKAKIPKATQSRMKHSGRTSRYGSDHGVGVDSQRLKKDHVYAKQIEVHGPGTDWKKHWQSVNPIAEFANGSVITANPKFSPPAWPEPSNPLWPTIMFRWFNYIPTGQVLLGTHFWSWWCPIERYNYLLRFGDEDTDASLEQFSVTQGKRSRASIHHKSGKRSVQTHTKRPDRYEQLGEPLANLLVATNFDDREIKRRLEHAQKIVTGGYMIKTYNGMDKVSGICKALQNVHDKLGRLELSMQVCPTMKQAWEMLIDFPFLGPFMAYEVVTDLRHTSLGQGWSDILTWANLGPGAIRGLNRMLSPSPKNLEQPIRESVALEKMAVLLECTQEAIINHNKLLPVPTIRPVTADEAAIAGFIPGVEMREIEHSLCEFDKFVRAMTGDGKMKRTYPGAK